MEHKKPEANHQKYNNKSQSDSDFEKLLLYNKKQKKEIQNNPTEKDRIKRNDEQNKLDKNKLVSDSKENIDIEEINNMIQMIQLILNNQYNEEQMKSLDLNKQDIELFAALNNKLLELTEGQYSIKTQELSNKKNQKLSLTSSSMQEMLDIKTIVSSVKEFIQKLQKSSNVNEDLKLHIDSVKADLPVDRKKQELNARVLNELNDNTKLPDDLKPVFQEQKTVEIKEKGNKEEKLMPDSEKDTEMIKFTALIAKGEAAQHSNLFFNEIEYSDFKQVDINVHESKISLLDHSKDIQQKIMEQVVEKMKLHVGEHDSEIHLQLKPDNLGKLTISISVEKGIVIAQIVAESQVVKEILESNFNSLRDALNQKGLGIQEFNVNLSQNQNSNSRYAFNGFNKRNKNKIDSSQMGYKSSNMTTEVVANRLGITSRIDFFA